MEKKAYIKPTMEVVKMEVIEMVATSVPKIDIVNPGEEGGSGEEILSNKRRGQWGNLWAKD